MTQTTSIEEELAAVFDAAGADGYLHAATLDGSRQVGVRSDDSVVAASVFKVPVLVELLCRVEAGDFKLEQRLRIGEEERVLGPTGLSAFQDDVEMSLRDLAVSMMSVSDNTATDVILDLVGTERVNERMEALGLAQTRLEGACRDIFRRLLDDAGLGPGESLETVTGERFAGCHDLQPDKTSRTTPREMGELFRLIWQDEAGPAAACAEARRILAQQVWPHRLRAGFPAGVKTAAKTGTLFLWRNEAGVVTYPDGSAYTVNVFTRARSFDDPQPAVDAAVGTAARRAVEYLRR